MERKEQWVEGTILSIENAHRASMDTSVYERILANAGKQGSRVIAISNNTILRVAAGIALLLALNVFSLAKLNSSTGNKQATGSNTFAQEYFSYNNEVQF